MTLRHLNIFIAVCEHDGNLSKAAESIYISQPTVSVAISELEKFYNVQLFERINRRLYITEEGKALYKQAVEIVDRFNNISVTPEPQNETPILKVGCCPTVGTCFLPFLLKKYTSATSNSTLSTVINKNDLLIDMILKQQLDLAIIDSPINNDKIASKDIYQTDIAVMASAKSGFSDGQEISLRNLLEQQLLLPNRGCGTREYFDHILAEHGCVAKPALESISFTALIQAVILNLGICIIPKRMVRNYYNEGKVVFLNVKNLDFSISCQIIWLKNKPLSTDGKLLCELCDDVSESRATT